MALSRYATMASPWFYTSFCFFLFVSNSIYIVSSSSSTLSADKTVSYTEHCSSIVPESSPTVRTYENFMPSRFTSYYFTGGDRLLHGKTGNQTYYQGGKFLRLRILRNNYETIANDIYKVEARLYILSPYRYYYDTNRSSNGYGGSYYHRKTSRGSIVFLLTGFWSGISRKLCMVGSASWKEVEEGKALDLDAVLKLSYAAENPNVYTSVVSGTLESTVSANDPRYFDPILIFDFPILVDYNYSLVSKELSGGSEVSRNRSLDLQPNMFCSVLSGKPTFLELGYDAMNCKGPPHDHCSPLGFVGFLPRFLSLRTIQCSAGERKLRYMATLQNMSYIYDQDFSLDSTLIGEASWDDKNNHLSGVLCRILNPAKDSGKAVGDCTMRWILRYPSIWNIRNDAKINGHFWSSKAVEDSGYFRKVDLKSPDEVDVVDFPGLRYEYTEMARVRKSCPLKKQPLEKGNTYPDGHSYDMRFDLSVESSKGEQIGWGFAFPLSIGNDLYERNSMILAVKSTAPPEFAPEISAKSSSSPLNISYRITIHHFAWVAKSGNWSSIANRSMNLENRMEITAEGVYDSKTGYLCMVGCRETASYIRNPTNSTTKDCEVLVRFEFASLNDNRGGFIKGKIESTRAKTDPLHFKDLNLSSAAYYSGRAEETISRMDLEITMVLISNTLSCIFIVLQIFHVRRNPEVLSCISLIMLVILALGHVIPLVLNFEALFLNSNHNKQASLLSSGGWIEANEVTLRVITMIAFLLHVRLLQLVWSSKEAEASEKKAAFVSLPIYVFGGFLTLVLNWTRNKHGLKIPLWGDLRSYAGLILDGFLLPQIVLNAVRGGSAEKALSCPFYVGVSGVRLVPHAYDQYRARNYPASDVNGTYLYANPSVDFYSTAWDIVIPCGVVAMAVIVFLQQRHGGRWILPRRFRELELYEKVPVVNNE